MYAQTCGNAMQVWHPPRWLLHTTGPEEAPQVCIAVGQPRTPSPPWLHSPSPCRSAPPQPPPRPPPWRYRRTACRSQRAQHGAPRRRPPAGRRFGEDESVESGAKQKRQHHLQLNCCPMVIGGPVTAQQYTLAPPYHCPQPTHPRLLLGPVLGVPSRLRRAVRRALCGVGSAARGAAGGVGGGVCRAGGGVCGLTRQVLGLLQGEGVCKWLVKLSADRQRCEPPKLSCGSQTCGVWASRWNLPA